VRRASGVMCGVSGQKAGGDSPGKRGGAAPGRRGGGAGVHVGIGRRAVEIPLSNGVGLRAIQGDSQGDSEEEGSFHNAFRCSGCSVAITSRRAELCNPKITASHARGTGRRSRKSEIRNPKQTRIIRSRENRKTRTGKFPPSRQDRGAGAGGCGPKTLPFLDRFFTDF